MITSVNSTIFIANVTYCIVYVSSWRHTLLGWCGREDAKYLIVFLAADIFSSILLSVDADNGSPSDNRSNVPYWIMLLI